MNLRRTIVLGLALLFMSATADAAQISDLVQTSMGEQARRFFTMSDPSVRNALIGSLLLGISCGLLGSFAVVRKISLLGDALSHAVLPGVALGFLWNMTKDPAAIFIGATAAGLFGTVMVEWITRTTRIKEDAALGLVLATFFAVGLCMTSMIQRLPNGNKSGIDKFFFGQAAALDSGDIQLMTITTVLTLVLVTLFYKELLITSFDPAFARSVGLPIRLLHEMFMLLLAFAVVIALQAVGVVLVSAMLITPAAAAYLLTDRMHRMLILAAIFGMLSGAIGSFFSFLGNDLPTGPFMVIGASTVFAIAFFFAPRHGLLPRWWRQRSRVRRISRENTLKAVYHVLEDRSFEGESVSLEELAVRARCTVDEARTLAQQLAEHRLASLDVDRGALLLMPEGWRLATSVVRNHRLWELYLTNAADYPPDHVHEDAEKIEHILGEQTVRDLERRLEFPARDPHGKPIPNVREISSHDAASAPAPQSGYRGRK